MSAVVQDLGVPVDRQVKLTAILNALEVQIEEGGDSPEVNGYLLDALRVAIRHQVGERAAVAALRAIDAFAQAEEERWVQARAGTLPPVVPSDEVRLDDFMQEGYERLESGDTAAACDRWLAAWEMVKHLATPVMRDVEAFDAAHGLLQSIFNWSQDLAFELANAGLKDPAYYAHLIRYSEEYLAQFPADSPDRALLFERERADALWALGNAAEAEAAHATLVTRFPDQGWAYIGWADNYWLNRHAPADYERAAAILQGALARPTLQDRKDVLMRVGEVYQAWGRPPPVVTVPAPRHARGHAAGGSAARPVPPPGQKLGRNDRCWCGSGKKYKHCHLDADAKQR